MPGVPGVSGAVDVSLGTQMHTKHPCQKLQCDQGQATVPLLGCACLAVSVSLRVSATCGLVSLHVDTEGRPFKRAKQPYYTMHEIIYSLPMV